jgi:hypothetical protein
MKRVDGWIKQVDYEIPRSVREHLKPCFVQIGTSK